MKRLLISLSIACYTNCCKAENLTNLCKINQFAKVASKGIAAAKSSEDNPLAAQEAEAKYQANMNRLRQVLKNGIRQFFAVRTHSPYWRGGPNPFADTSIDDYSGRVTRFVAENGRVYLTIAIDCSGEASPIKVVGNFAPTIDDPRVSSLPQFRESLLSIRKGDSVQFSGNLVTQIDNLMTCGSICADYFIVVGTQNDNTDPLPLRFDNLTKK